MKQTLKRFLIYSILVGVFTFVLFVLLKRYDFNGNTVDWINSNRNYLLVLGVSIVFCLSIYGKGSAKSKFILYFIVFINFLYLCFLFFVGNVGLSQTAGLLILAFLVLGFLGIYVKGWMGYTILTISLVGCLIILFLGSVPMFEKGPDFEGFENVFDNKILIYSKFDLSEDSAQIVKDNRVYSVFEGLNAYDLKITNLSSQIVFKSDDHYNDVYCFLVFKGGSFVEILPQSAIVISDNFEINILTGTVKYYVVGSKYFSFVGGDIEQETSNEVIKLVDDWYKDSLKTYLKSELGSDLLYNESVLKISKKVLIMLSKIFPGKYEKNLKNLQDYVDVFGIDLDRKIDSDGKFSTKSVLKNMWGGVKKGIDMVD